MTSASKPSSPSARQGGANPTRNIACNTLPRIFTPWGLPPLTGVDLVHRARARARALRPSVRAVIITGFAEIDAFDPALHDSLVMTKPFKREALIRAVSGLVARRHRRQ